MDYKEFFSFTLQERRGILIFFILSMIVILGVEYWPSSGNHTLPLDKSLYYFPTDSIDISSDDDSSSERSLETMWEEPLSQAKVKKTKQKFAFDPNRISADSLELLGFSKYGARSLISYRSKGGTIKSTDKLKSIYGIDTNLVNELKDFIQITIPKKGNETDSIKIKKNPMENKQAIVDLNTTDSVSLDAIKGVGPYMVKRIMAYRKKLGGYLYKEQLTELNIIPDSLYQPVSQYFSADPSKIKKININTADYKTFTTNPYFSPETTNAILKYRKQHGDFSDVKHISRIRSLKEETGKKILPYLTI